MRGNLILAQNSAEYLYIDVFILIYDNIGLINL